MLNLSLQLSSLKKVSMPYIRGYEEDGFVKQLDVSRQELEILAPDKVESMTPLVGFFFIYVFGTLIFLKII